MLHGIVAFLSCDVAEATFVEYFPESGSTLNNRWYESSTPQSKDVSEYTCDLDREIDYSKLILNQ